MPDERAVVAPYSGGAQRSRAAAVAAAIRKKIELRCLMAVQTAKIQQDLLHLDPAEHEELRSLLAKDSDANDGEIYALTVESERLESEARAADGVKPLHVSLSKGASKLLHLEIQRRLSLGHCPPLELLVEQGLRRAYG